MEAPTSSNAYRGAPTPHRALPGALSAVLLALVALAVTRFPAAPLAVAVSPVGSSPVPTKAAPPPLPGLLSQTGFGFGELLAYSPQYPLWTDGAAKLRFVSLPAGSFIDGSDPDDWILPAGTRFWKEFSFGERVETRYLEKLLDGSVRFATYVWDGTLGDARLAPEQGVADAHAIGGGVRHDIPARTDCLACHEGRASRVLGFNALQLSPDRDPLAPHAEAMPAGAVDLRELAARGLLRHFPRHLLEQPPRIAASSVTGRAAQGYLFGNCAGCHNAKGPLAELGLNFDQSVAETTTQPRNVGERSRFRLPGEQASLRLAPGKPEHSAVWFRMRSRDAIARMPPLGTELVDPEGSALIRRWIAKDLVLPTTTNRK